MARIRTIKPEFSQSESMGRISRDARLLFILLWTMCDDQGRTRAASRMLASTLFPYDDDAFTSIDKWLGELERERCIVRYVVDGSAYLQVLKWEKHQKIDRPSRSKFPGVSDSGDSANTGSYDEDDGDLVDMSRGSPEYSPRIREDSGTTREGSSGDQGRDQGREGKGSGEGAGPKKTGPSDRPKASGGLVDSSPVVCSLPLKGGGEFEVTADHVAAWEKAFPERDVPKELAKMRVWLAAATERRKTARGIERFVVGWLGRAEFDSGGRTTSAGGGVSGVTVLPSRPWEGAR